MPCAIEKIVALPPMTSAISTIAVALSAGDFVTMRKPNRRSWKSCSSAVQTHTARVRSFTRAGLPSAIRKARSASARDEPPVMRRSVSCARWKRSSSSRLRSTDELRKIYRRSRFRMELVVIPFLWLSKHAHDGPRQARPPITLLLQLAAAGRREAIELRALLVLGEAPLGVDPAASFEPVQGG